MIAKNEIIFILKALNSKEWLWLDKFLASPYHNSDQRLRQVGKYFKSTIPHFEWQEKEAYAYCFPKQAFDARKWGDLLRKFLTVLQEFLVQQQLRASPATARLIAIDSRIQRQLYELAQAEIDAYEAAISLQSLPPWEEASAYRRRWQKQYELPGKPPAMEEAHHAINYNRLLYCLLELRYRIEHQIVNTKAYLQDTQQEMALLALAKNISNTWPVLNLYIYTYLTLRDAPPAPALLKKSEQYYYSCFADLHSKDRTFFFTKLFVLFNRNSNAQRPHAKQDIFRLVAFAVDRRIFLEAEKMTERTFLNICTVGLAVNEFQWVEQFREIYLSQLDIIDNTNVKLLSGALLEFGRGNYEKVYLLSNEATRLPLGHRLQLYGVQLKALTERYLLNEINANLLKSHLRAADRFLRYHPQVSAHLKTSFLSLIKILRKLIYMRERRERSHKIKARLIKMKTEAPSIIAVDWLQEKIDQL